MIVKFRFCKLTKKIQNTVLKDKKLSKPGSTYMERSLLTLVNHELTVIKPISARLLNQKTLNQQHMPSWSKEPAEKPSQQDHEGSSANKHLDEAQLENILWTDETRAELSGTFEVTSN